jgi:hypothetical protein
VSPANTSGLRPARPPRHQAAGARFEVIPNELSIRQSQGQPTRSNKRLARNELIDRLCFLVRIAESEERSRTQVMFWRSIIFAASQQYNPIGKVGWRRGFTT